MAKQQKTDIISQAYTVMSCKFCSEFRSLGVCSKGAVTSPTSSVQLGQLQWVPVGLQDRSLDRDCTVGSSRRCLHVRGRQADLRINRSRSIRCIWHCRPLAAVWSSTVSVRANWDKMENVGGGGLKRRYLSAVLCAHCTWDASICEVFNFSIHYDTFNQISNFKFQWRPQTQSPLLP